MFTYVMDDTPLVTTEQHLYLQGYTYMLYIGQAIMAPHTYIAGVYLQQGKQNPWLSTEKSVALQLPYTPLTISQYINNLFYQFFIHMGSILSEIYQTTSQYWAIYQYYRCTKVLNLYRVATLLKTLLHQHYIFLWLRMAMMS